MSILEIKDLQYFYQDGDARRYILKNLDATFERGKLYVIVGRSGSGKTTLLSILSGMDKQTAGKTYFNGSDLDSLDLNAFRRNNIGMVFQSYNLIPYMTAHENLLSAMSITDNDIPGSESEIAYNLLDYFGITKTKADRLVIKLSGGEQQRVAITRALATNVDLILADEPTGNLDVETEMEIIEILKNLAHKHNKCIIVVTHSQELASHADETLFLDKGVFVVNE